MSFYPLYSYLTLRHLVRTPKRFARHFGGGLTNYEIPNWGTSSSDAPFLIGDRWTVLVFVKADGGTSDQQTLVSSWGASGEQQLLLDVDDDSSTDKTLRLISHNSFVVTTIANIIEVGKWCLVAIVSDGSDWTLYAFDDKGSLLGSSTDTHNDTTNPHNPPVSFGATDTGINDGSGDIAQVSYILRDLSLAELSAYAVEPLTAVERNWSYVEFYLPFGQGGNVEPDFGPFKRNCTRTNGVATSVIPFDAPYTRLESLRPFFVPRAAPAGGATPKGPLGHPLHGPLGGPI